MSQVRVHIVMFRHSTLLLATQVDEIIKGLRLLKDSSVDKVQLLLELYTSLALCLSLFLSYVIISSFFQLQVHNPEKAHEITNTMMKENALDILSEIISSNTTSQISVC